MEWISSVPQFLAGGLAIGAVYGLTGAGFSLIYNTSKVINFAQGQFVVFGGLITVSLVQFGLGPALAIPLTMAGTVLLGGALQSLLSTARKGSDQLTYIMVTIGVGIALEGAAHQIWGTDFQTFSLYPDKTIRLLGASVNYATLSILAVTVLVCFAMWFFLYRTLLGKAMRACAEDSRVALTLGIRPQRMIMGAYVVSGFLGGLSGVLITPSLMMSYDSGVLLAIKGITAAIIGGISNPFGAVVGGVMLGLFEALGVGIVSSDLQNAYAYVVLLVVLLVRPQGLFSRSVLGSAR